MSYSLSCIGLQQYSYLQIIFGLFYDLISFMITFVYIERH